MRNSFRLSLGPLGKKKNGQNLDAPPGSPVSRSSGEPAVALSPLPSPRFLESPQPTYQSPRPQSSRVSSRRNSVGSRYFGGAGDEDIAMIKADVVANWLHSKQMQLMWTSGAPGEGVILKQSRDNFVACPRELSEVRGDLFDAVSRLNVKIAMTVNTSAIKILLSSQDSAHVELANGLSLQILPSIAYLPTCQVHHFAAFIQDTATLVVWGDDPTSIVTRVTKIEEQILTASLGSSKESMMSMSNLSKSALVSEKQIEDDEDTRPRKEVPRRVAVFHAVLTAFTLALMMTALGSGWRQIAVEIDYDHSYLRLAFIAVMPLQAWLGLFFFQSIVGCVAQLIGPISQTTSNSKFYSGTPPVRPERNAAKPLPHVTIQCPVYKEGLHSVIMPTVQSLKAAISMYEMQGGSANIFINDDGMQLISEYEAQLRRDFYSENHIGWVARPKHNTDASNGEPVFIRPGRFKKASNMNYALSLSARVEEKLSRYNRAGGWTQLDEEDAYVHCLQEVLHEDNGRTWAEGSIRIGDYILLIDSDTRVPVDCFMDPVTEMEQSPEVAIIQFPSGVLNVTHSFFENGITFFTTLVYTAISYVVACGDICPFVGHNAFLRWSAIQEVAFQELDQSTTQNPKMVEKFWSENTVSEDFDLALRLQTVGYTLRLAYYKGYEFKEGVSLTVYDELARWKKYAYGCSELIFHPLYYWPTHGPLTPLFRKFITSGMPLPSKVSVLAYVGTYYAIGSAYLMITANFFLVGWYAQNLDHYYIDSFRILFSILIVFSGVGMFAIAILRYRIGEMHFLNSLWQNVKWVLLLYIFFGGISMHVSGAILSHMFGVNMQWGATMKEVQDTTFFVEIGKLLKRFWATFLYCTVMIGVMIYLTEFAPPLWQINEFIAIVPLSATVFSHFLMPIALNPSLMLFTW